MVILNLCGAGDHIVAASTLYRSTINQLHPTFPKVGIKTTFVDPDDPEKFRRAVQPNTKLFWGETLGNPRTNVFLFEAVSNISYEHAIPLVIDNTFATPYLCRSFEWGANIVVHSTTKYVSDHGTTIGGVVVDGGNFDWAASDHVPDFTPLGHLRLHHWNSSRPQPGRMRENQPTIHLFVCTGRRSRETQERESGQLLGIVHCEDQVYNPTN